jgi:peptidoglycan/xylan/chitin deacetylase (PgdA/CDA1 family)
VVGRSGLRAAALVAAACLGVLGASPSYGFAPSGGKRTQQPLPLGHGHRTIALTFDDGPDPTWTPQVLRLLAQAGVPATFCEIGYAVEAHPELTRRVLHAGNLLCDHSQTHDEDLPARSPQRIRWEIRHAEHVIAHATHGIRPEFFRAPGGAWSREVVRQTRAAGLRPLRWNVDPSDWSRPGVHAIVHRILDQVHPGSVILLHDGGGDRSETVAALRILLRRLPREGYRFTVPPGPRH